MKKTLLGLSCLFFLLASCKTTYEHLTGYPGANDRIISSNYKYHKTETFFFSQSSSSSIYGVSGDSRDVLQIKDGSSLRGTIQKITSDSIYLENNQNIATNYVSNISFGSNPNKQPLQESYDLIRKPKQMFVYPTYYALNEYVHATYGQDALFANAVWDVMVYGMKRSYTSVTFDVYTK